MKTLLYHISWKSLKFFFRVSKEYGTKVALCLFTTPLFKKIRPRERPFLESRHMRMSAIGKRNISYGVYGEGEDLVLTLHGWEGNAGSMGSFIESFNQAGLKVISLNAPAHYQSDGKTCSVQDYAKVIAHFIQLHRPRAIVAHSFGCAALVIAMGNVAHDIKRLVLISAPNQMEKIVDRFVHLMKMDMTQRHRFTESLEKRLQLPLKDARLDEMLQKVCGKILILHDREDRIIPFNHALEIVSANPNIALMPTEGKGHYRILWDAGITQEVTSFIGNCKQKE